MICLLPIILQSGQSELGSPRLAPLARSMPSLRPQTEDWDSWVRIPSFVLRGVGRQARYEYEMRLRTEDEVWVLMRRYRRFRELHLSMCSKYGRQVCYFFENYNLNALSYELIKRDDVCYTSDMSRLSCSSCPWALGLPSPGGYWLPGLNWLRETHLSALTKSPPHVSTDFTILY